MSEPMTPDEALEAAVWVAGTGNLRKAIRWYALAELRAQADKLDSYTWEPYSLPSKWLRQRIAELEAEVGE